MKYIKEYSIFDIFKKKSPKVPLASALKELTFDDFKVKFDMDRVILNDKSDEVILIKKYDVKEKDLNRKENFREGFLVMKTDDEFISIWTNRPKNSEYKCADLKTSDIDKKLMDLNLLKGNHVFINDIDKNGKIKEAYTAILSEFSLSSDIKKGIITKILEIDCNSEIIYRFPHQVKHIKDESKINLSKEIHQQIEDYLLDMSESSKFDIKISGVEKEEVIDHYLIEIKIKGGMQLNLDLATEFFSNISKLKNRLKLIDGCEVEIEDLTKSSIILKVMKSVVRESVGSIFCDKCGEELFDDDYDLCYKCRSGEDADNVDDVEPTENDKKELPSFGVETTRSQNIYYL